MDTQRFWDTVSTKQRQIAEATGERWSDTAGSQEMAERRGDGEKKGNVNPFTLSQV